ncbi:MAG: hypothetical protein FWG70_11675 [Oscillospiraceae bacterium]|nr:hypothetical protein [Oscillospiraceae bacterium]
MSTLNTAFKQVFGEALEPLGFKLIKSKYPYFVRVVEGGEILHIITYREEGLNRIGYISFNILGGVATVYRPSLADLEKSPSVNINWLKGNLELYEKSKSLNNKYDFSFDDLYMFHYKEETIVESVKHSLEITKKIMLPSLDAVIDLNSCIKYLETVKPHLGIGRPIDINRFITLSYDEGLLYVKTNNLDVGFYDKVYYDPELYSKYINELERRKATNTEILKSFGFNI